MESLLPPVEPRMASYAASALALPELTLEAAEWAVAAKCAEAVAAAAAEAVESLLPPLEPRMASYAAPALALPELTLAAAEWAVAAKCAEAVAAPAAEAVESLLPPVEPRMASYAASALALPELTLEAAEWAVAAKCAEAVAAAAAEAVESLLPPAPAPRALPQPIPAPRLPLATIAAAEPEDSEELAASLAVAPPSECWMTSPPAAEVVREVVPWVAGALVLKTNPCTPGVASLAAAQPMVRWAGGWQSMAAAEPVSSYVSPQFQETVPAASAESSPLCLPDLDTLDVRRNVQRGQRAALAEPATGDYPHAVETPRTAAPAQSPQAQGHWAHLLRFPALAVEQDAANAAARFQPAELPASASRESAPATGPAMRRSAADLAAPEPLPPADVPYFSLPRRGPVVMEFFCQRAAITPVRSLEPIPCRPAIQPPKFAVRPRFERIDEVEAPREPKRRTPAFAEIFAIRKAARRRAPNGLRALGRVIAASLLVGIGLWFGAGAARIGRQMLAMHSVFPRIGVPLAASAPARVSPGTAPAFSSVRPVAEPAAPPQGPLARVRHAIQQRAALELTDTFRQMEAWGASAKVLPAGWSRHADGYVRIGQLALFRPSQSFTDYHFEFFGEIEKKGMSWAVRAHDPQNYYAMKFTVVEPGLRPMIAVVHYPVVDGKKGRRVETPLNVMVHNHEPYHVAVDVKGNRIVTSIEGQEVDSWTDDRLKAGGVGFFSEAGESARLYWIRVAKNQDWLGQVCAYLSGGSDTNVAELSRGEIPAAPPQLPPPAPSGADVTVAAAETEDFSHAGPQRARILKYGRTEPCRS